MGATPDQPGALVGQDCILPSGSQIEKLRHRRPGPPRPGAGRVRRIAAVVQTVILAAAVAYIAWGLAGQWAELRRHAWTLRPLPALLSLTLAAGWFVLRVRLWQRILACFGYPLAYRRAYRTWLLSELSRYLPGTVWHVLSRSHLSGRQGVPAPVALTGIMLELALVALVAVALFPLRAIGYGHPLEGVGIWALAAALVLLVLAHPQVVGPLVNAGLRRLSRPAIQARLRYRDLFGMLALCAAMWLCLCLGFAAFAYAIAPAAGGAPPAGRSAIAIAASFPVAWVVGLVAVAAPGGLGVREGVLAALLSGVLPGGVAVVVALASRVWLTGVELLCAAVAWRLRE